MFRTVLLTCGLSVLAMVAPSGQQSSPESPRVIYIVAERFTFTPSTITVDQGTFVQLRISSDDTSHGFKLNGLNDANVEIPKRNRGEVRVTFEAKEPGTYLFECSRVCGAGHGFMRGTVRVRPR